jgi:hypothetical protein
MKNINFGKKYLLSSYDYKYEGIYLGKSLNKNKLNRHVFMVLPPYPKSEPNPFIIGCQDFKIHPENKLEVFATRMNFPKLSEKEKDYVKELGKKYWK